MFLTAGSICGYINIYAFDEIFHLSRHFKHFPKHWVTNKKVALFGNWVKHQSTLIRHREQAHVYTPALSSAHLLRSSADLSSTVDAHRGAALLRLNPTTATTNLIRLERCKPFFPMLHVCFCLLAYNFPTLSEFYRLHKQWREAKIKNREWTCCREGRITITMSEPRWQVEFTVDTWGFSVHAHWWFDWIPKRYHRHIFQFSWLEEMFPFLSHY